MSHLVKKTALGMPVNSNFNMKECSILQLAELNNPSDGNGANHPSLYISQIR